MVGDGYAAVSSRRVADAVGIAPALVHYYYPTTDDLFIAIHRRMTERHIAKLSEVLASNDPLRALWRFQTTWAQAPLGVEFIALANHRKGIRKQIARQTAKARQMQAEALAPILVSSRIDLGPLTAESLTTLLMSAARTLINEKSIGITNGHEDVRTFVEWALDKLAAASEPEMSAVQRVASSKKRNQ
jgi:TetR/AcrR family transcriptional regulator, regulator of autoinduction and epiphytic fitness